MAHKDVVVWQKLSQPKVDKCAPPDDACIGEHALQCPVWVLNQPAARWLKLADVYPTHSNSRELKVALQPANNLVQGSGDLCRSAHMGVCACLLGS